MAQRSCRSLAKCVSRSRPMPFRTVASATWMCSPSTAHRDIQETDDGGGYVTHGLSRRESILQDLEWAQHNNAIMAVHIRSIWEDEP